jgi:hypothetical protein
VFRPPSASAASTRRYTARRATVASGMVRGRGCINGLSTAAALDDPAAAGWCDDTQNDDDKERGCTGTGVLAGPR